MSSGAERRRYHIEKREKDRFAEQGHKTSSSELGCTIKKEGRASESTSRLCRGWRLRKWCNSSRGRTRNLEERNVRLNFTNKNTFDLPGGKTDSGTLGTSSAIITAKPLGEHRHINIRRRRKQDRDSLLQVPINVAMKEPWPRVISLEPDRDIIVRAANVYDVAQDWVVVVVRRVARAADDVEDMSMQVERVLIKNAAAQQSGILEGVSQVTNSPARQCWCPHHHWERIFQHSD